MGDFLRLGRGWGHLGYIESELPFRAPPEYHLRAADVAFVSKKRWDGVEDEDDLLGAPELVIEVLSRSDRAAKLQELAALCLSGGTQELWAIDPLGLFGGELAVSEIFA